MFIIDKIFNLKIDTKNKNISTVTGFKQFDNNSILNIILLQNNLALDLSNCTVRINFLREDNKVLLYMANIVSAKEGKLSIKLSPEVLEKAGAVQSDISVFDSNLLKITSATFNMKVEKSIYTADTYFNEKDLDMMQQEYIREKERESNENSRKSNETTRITKENQRNSNENTRISNEETRKKAENTRVEEWNNVKKDATNIKNTLDNTISTANNTNSNLKNTITSGDKLKADLNINSYVKNEDYQKFKKESSTQYEDLVQDIKKNATKTVTKEANIMSLDNGVGGIANVVVGGNTVENLIPNSKINETSSAYGFGSRTLTKELVAGKTYTLIVNARVDQKALDTKKQLTCFAFEDSWVEHQSVSIASLSNTTKCIKFIPKHTKKYTVSNYLYPKDGNRSGKATVNWSMLLEGDWTNNLIEKHFDGIKSVGELENNKIEITSCGKNLIDEAIIKKYNSYSHNGLSINTEGNKIRVNGTATENTDIDFIEDEDKYFIKAKQNTKYTLSEYVYEGSASGYHISSKLINNDGSYNWLSDKITTCQDSKGICRIRLYAIKGAKFNNFLFSIQLEENTKATAYEPYIGDKVSYTLKDPLRGLPNGTRDTINSDGTITRRVAKVTFNGSEDITLHSTKNNTLVFRCPVVKNIKPNGTNTSNIIVNNFNYTNFETIYSDSSGIESVSTHSYEVLSSCYIAIQKCKLSTEDVQGFKKWLSENPTTVIYELAETIIENAGQPLAVKTFENGIIQVDIAIPPLLTVNYASNLNSRINSIEEASSIIKNNLGGAWRTLLILADKELKMKSINVLTKDSNAELKNKINELIGVWK